MEIVIILVTSWELLFSQSVASEATSGMRGMSGVQIPTLWPLHDFLHGQLKPSRSEALAGRSGGSAPRSSWSLQHCKAFMPPSH